MQLTRKQLDLLQVIAYGNPDGTPVDLDQVLERITYTTTKQSLQFSIRALVAKGLIQKGAREVRRARERQTLVATELGGSYFGVKALARALTSPEIE